MTISCTQTSGFLIEDAQWLGYAIGIMRCSEDRYIREIGEHLDAIRAGVYYQPVRPTVEIEIAEVPK